MATHPIKILVSSALCSLILTALLAWSATHVTTQTATANQLYEPASLNQLSQVSQVSQVRNAPLETATPAACGLAWRLVPSPSSFSYSLLQDVAAIASNDVWAVGQYHDANQVTQALIIHWDGSQWSVVNWSEAGINAPILTGIEALAANDIWVVGSYGGGARTTLVLHWDGIEWRRVASPNPTNNSRFHSVSALSSDDIWAVGYTVIISGGFGVEQTLIEHWDGAQWSVVPSPNVGSENNLLNSVTVVSPNDVWAVGLYHESAYYRTLALHWDGVQWSVVPAPQFDRDEPFGIEAISYNDVWIVGRSDRDTLILHWDGVQWSHVPSPNFDGQINELFAVAGTGPNDVWAVGNHCDCATKDWNLVVHWDGLEWSVVPSPSPGLISDKFYGVSALNAGEVWAVGEYNNGSAFRTITERYFDPCLTLTPSPTSTSISSTATATPLSTFPSTSTSTSTSTATSTSVPTASSTTTAISTSTATSTATATVCTIIFTDVGTDHTFYPYIRCLACHQIINGYPCGGDGEPCDQDHNPYFRPGNHVTRGQLAKIVAISAGYNDPVSGQSFEDVPVGSTFYVYVERSTLHQVMSGYVCGGPSEPCVAPGNRPYFRPNSTATRGQLTKIVSNAAGFGNMIPDGQYTFTDVPSGSTFWLFMERLLANRPGVMGGYSCGGPGEPCDDQNRPYFRPGNNVTRGQTSKIVTNTFFPGCNPPRR